MHFFMLFLRKDEAIVIFVSCGLLGHPLRVETMADGGILEVVVDVLSITRWTVGYYYLNFLAPFKSLHISSNLFK